MDKESKRLYDIEYRKKNKIRLSRQRKERHKRTYRPDVAAEKYKERSKDPNFREKRLEYSRRHEGKKYAEFSDVLPIIQEITEHIYQTIGQENHPTKTRIYKRHYRRRNYVRTQCTKS